MKRNYLKRYNLAGTVFGDRHECLPEFEEKIGIQFFNKDLLRTAMTHRSCEAVTANHGLEYGRLEFLGDSVLGSIVSRHLYDTHACDQGALSVARSHLVCNAKLAVTAYCMGMHHYVRIGKKSGNAVFAIGVLSDTFEAVLGALYVDLGHAACEDYLKRTVLSRSDVLQPALAPLRTRESWKGRLANHHRLPAGACLAYEPVVRMDETGLQASPVVVSLKIDGKYVAKGEAYSLECAEENAARTALLIKNWV